MRDAVGQLTPTPTDSDIEHEILDEGLKPASAKTEVETKRETADVDVAMSDAVKDEQVDDEVKEDKSMIRNQTRPRALHYHRHAIQRQFGPRTILWV